MPINFSNKAEKLYRAIWPRTKKPNFWKSNGKISSAALKDPKGLSVDRTGRRSEAEALRQVKDNFTGSVVSITISDCQNVKATVFPMPSKKNRYHCEIHGNENVPEMSDSQCRGLAKNARIEYQNGN